MDRTRFNGHSVKVVCLNMKRDLGMQYEALPLGNECRSVRRGPRIPSGCCGPNFYTERENNRGPRSCPTQLKIQLLMTQAQSLPRGLFGPLRTKCATVTQQKVQSLLGVTYLFLMITEGSSRQAYLLFAVFEHHLPEAVSQVSLHHQRPK